MNTPHAILSRLITLAKMARDDFASRQFGAHPPRYHGRDMASLLTDRADSAIKNVSTRIQWPGSMCEVVAKGV